MLGSFDGAEHDVRAAPRARSPRTPRASWTHATQVPSPPGRRLPRRGAASSAASPRSTSLPEAIELPDRRFVLGVQWHPEADAESRSSARSCRPPARVARTGGAPVDSGGRGAPVGAERSLIYSPPCAAVEGDQSNRLGDRRGGCRGAAAAQARDAAAGRDADGRLRRAGRPVRGGRRARAHATWRLCALQMWAYLAAYKSPHDDAEAQAAARARSLSDRRRPRARPGRAADRAPAARARAHRRRTGPSGGRSTACSCGRTGAGSWCPHGTVAYMLVRHPAALPARGGDDLRGLRHRRDRLLARSRPRRPGTRRAPPRRTGGRQPPTVRRMMVEYGEHFWRDGWGSLYSVFGGNPLAAMPSLHFATSVMAALLLAEVGPVAGRARLRLRGDARVRARVPRGALRRGPARGGGADGERCGGSAPRAGPALDAYRAGRWRRWRRCAHEAA